MERRVLLAVFLSFMVLYIYGALIAPPPSTPVDEAGGSMTSSSESPPFSSTAASDNPSFEPRSISPSSITAVDQPTPAPVVGETEPRDIVVENDWFRAVFVNRGAELVSWQLKEYLEEGQPVELVPFELPVEEPWPFSLAFEDERFTDLAHQALYRVSSSHVTLTDREETLTFDYEDATGLRIRKSFRFNPSSSHYLFTLSVEASLGQQQLNPSLRWGPALGGVESTSSGFAFRQGPRGILHGRLLEEGTFQDLDTTRVDAADVVTQPTYQGQMEFLGVDNHYFLAAALPQAQDAMIRFRPVPLPSRTPEGEPRDLMAFDLSLPGGFNDVAFYLGPKDFDILEIADSALPLSIEFGFLSVLVVPLHRSLTWVHSSVGNWGFSIIILTILINIVIFPLRHKSVVSMRKMQELQPQMKAIQDRYKNLKATDPDKQKMNKEVMNLYREQGVNPASGCLPMIATMPILFAFYRLLSMAIEMRGAPFMLWITDLSVHDPLYITPIVMGGTMVLQQRLTPSQADPMQQKMMMLMPIVFTFMFLWAPSGLVVYWLTSNVLGIGQQLITNRLIGPSKVRTVRPPAERQIKKNVRKGKSVKQEEPPE